MVSAVEVLQHALNRKNTPGRAPERVSKVILLQGIFYILIGEPYSDLKAYLHLSQGKKGQSLF